MDDRLHALYHLPNISEYQDIHLQSLREHRLMLEEQICQFLTALPEHQRQTVEAYIDLRDELEFESAKAALRFGKRHLQ